ncbi:NAD-dependent epimerase/dehydratase family protein [Agromyces badenianii]|uniref:NAD-dependent epimerase/dehydratase family protein n=1 Tax=Agromyces badenianii TaxID=2080742 RepID=UPI000D594252|nr:NAD-dependent epimerase/dehydratase family protein [Agromyces badenianii]PWC03771.1 NAD-dependent dehydratase [Agromyces badenianii]
MRILLTGGTGYIGSSLLDTLVASGHEVVAVVRSADAAARVRAQGAAPLEGEVTDAAWFGSALDDVDAAVHTAAPETGAEAFNSAVVDTVIEHFGGTGKRFVLTSGIWEFGAGEAIDDDGPLDPTALVLWRLPIEERLLASSVDATIVAPGVVYGHGRGLASLITDAPRTEAGELRLIGDGRQHWTWVHADDLARLYELALTHDSPLGRLIGSDGNPTAVRALAEAVAGGAGVAAEPVEVTRDRFGAAFADALLLDQRAFGGKARALGWAPAHTSVIEEELARASAV